MKSSKAEDQYEIIFHQSDWPEQPREMHFFEKKTVGMKSRIARENDGNCSKLLQKIVFEVWRPGSGSKFRSESNGDGPGPQKRRTLMEHGFKIDG